MTAPLVRQLSATEAAMGLYVFALMYDWKAWVHRRVEQVDFSGTVTYQRRISIDFTIPRKRTPLATQDGDPLFCMPLALLRKRRLRRFNLRDERGAALPLLTRHKNGAVAAGVLVAAAQEAMGTGTEWPPPAVYADLWTIANGAPERAIAAWERLGDARDITNPVEQRWRLTLSRNTVFRVLAADFTGSFLVLTILKGEFNQRRILKFEYEQQGDVPKSLFVVKRRARRAKRRQRVARRRHRRLTSGLMMLGGRGRLIVEARGDVPLEGVTVKVSPGRQEGQETTTDKDGRAVFALMPGEYLVDAEHAQGAAESQQPVGPVIVRLAHDSPATIVYQPVPDAALLNVNADAGPPLSLARKVLRSIAWRAKPIVIAAPAAGHGSSYHLEVEAPDGLKLTRAKLEQGSAPIGDTTVTPARDQEKGALQRTHLYLDDVPQGASAVGIVHLRPRASLIVRAGFVSGAITSLLLGVVTWLHGDLSGVVGSVATLLLFVPGGLSAYTARPRENALTGSMVFGLRLLTLAAGGLSLAAASIVIFGRSWIIDPQTKALKAGPEWSHAGLALGALTAVAVGITLILGLTWWWTRRMPEAKVS